jgi:hypothetical protein
LELNGFVSTYNSANNLNAFYNKNHALPFEKYSSRKLMFGQTNCPMVTYVEPAKHGNSPKGINFAKMLERTSRFGDTNNNPAIGYYKPNHDVIKVKNCRTIKFSTEKDLNKKYLLHKLWNSYRVGAEYKLVNLHTNENK